MKQQSTLMDFYAKLKDKKISPPTKEEEQLSDTPELPDRTDTYPNQLSYISPNTITTLWPKLRDTLNGIAMKSKISSFELQNAIEHIFKMHFNLPQTMDKRVNFSNLKRAIDQFEFKEQLLNGVIQGAAKLALNWSLLIPDYLALLIQDQQESLTLSREQAQCIIFNMFFCTLHKQPDHKRYSKWFIMARLFQHDPNEQMCKMKIEKIKCILNYIYTCKHKAMKNSDSITYQRRVLKDCDWRQHFMDLENDILIPSTSWQQNQSGLCSVQLKSSGKLQDEEGSVIVDFADKYVGGGVLGDGCVQEEILFLVFPECLPALLFTSRLNRYEALFISGILKYSTYQGYAITFQYEGYDNSLTSYSMSCIDAKDYRGADGWVQYSENEINSELTKAYVGFKPLVNAISTGRWGCGVFSGDWQLKFFLQWIAASVVKFESLTFYNIGVEDAEQQTEELQQIIPFVQMLSVGQLYTKVQLWAKAKITHQIPETLDLFQYLTLL